MRGERRGRLLGQPELVREPGPYLAAGVVDVEVADQHAHAEAVRERHEPVGDPTGSALASNAPSSMPAAIASASQSRMRP